MRLKIRYAYAITLFVPLVIFAIDTVTPLGYSGWYFYLLVPILLNSFSIISKAVYVTNVLVCTVLIIIGFYLSPTGAPVEISLANRTSGIFLFWLFTYFIYRVALARVQTEQSKQELDNLLVITQNRAAELQATIEAIPDGYVIYDPEGKVVQTNAMARRIMGLTEDVGRKKISERMNLLKIQNEFGEDLSFHEIPSYRALKGEIVRGQILKVNQQDQSYWLSISASPIRSDGKMSGAVMEFTDITRLHDLQEQLIYEKNFIATVLDTQGALVIMLDKTGRIVRFNRACQDISGYSFDEVSGKFVWDILILPEEQVGVKKVFGNLSKGNLLSEYENYWKTKGGARKFIRWRNSAVVDTKGDVEYIIGTGIDITDRMEAEQQIRKLNDELTSSEERFRKMFELHKAIMLLIEPVSGKIVDANNAATKFYGYSRDKLGALRIDDINQLSKSEVETERENALLGKRDYFVFPHKIADGEIRWVEVYSSPIRVQGQQLLFSVIHDITERKFAQDALRENEQRIRGLFDNAGVGLVEVDINDKFIAANKKMCEILGYTSDEILSMSIYHLTAPEDQGITTEFNTKLHSGNINQFSYEKRYLRSNGERVWVHVTVSGIYDTEGKLAGSIGTLEDISERKKAEEALLISERHLRNERELLQTIIDSIPVMLTIYDPNVKNIQLNKAVERITGWTNEDAAGSNLMELIYPDPEYRTEVSEYMRSLQPGFRDIKMTSKNGKLIDTSWANVLIPDGRQVGIGLDITERKLLEEELRKRAEELSIAYKELESFSYSVSHDLRGPLSTINGFSTILIEDYTDKIDRDGRDYLRRIQTETQKMQNLISDILNLSRIGRQEMSLRQVELSKLIEAFLVELQTNEPDRKVELEIEENISATADPRLIHVALENLLRNAWKFTSRKEITKIGFGVLKKDGKRIYFIKDNGAGFDMQYAEKIFEPFKRVHAEREYKGTGIGLSIVQRVINRHGGEIWAEGETDKGATFYFTLD